MKPATLVAILVFTVIAIAHLVRLALLDGTYLHDLAQRSRAQRGQA